MSSSWQPLATLLSAALVLLGAGLTLWQRRRADRKEQWWLRTQWALDQLISGREGRALLGAKVLAHQVGVPTVDDEDAAFLREVVTPAVDDYLRDLDIAWPDDETGSTESTGTGSTGSTGSTAGTRSEAGE